MCALKIIFLSLLLSPLLYAAKDNSLPDGQLVLTVKVAGKYGTELSRIYKTKEELVCVTEHSPFVPINEKTAEQSLYLLVQKFIKVSKKSVQKWCEKTVTVTLPKEGKASACADTPVSKEILHSVMISCARN